MKNGGKKTVVITDISQLGEAVKAISIKIPELKAPDLAGVEGDVDALANAMKAAREGVSNALAIKRQTDGLLAKFAGDKDKLKAAKLQVATSLAGIEQFLTDILGHGHTLVKQAAAIAYIQASLSVDFKNEREAHAALYDLENPRGIMAPVKDGPILIGYKRYSLDPKWKFQPEDVADISVAIDQFATRLQKLVKDQRQLDGAILEKRATISFEDMLAGDNGTCVIDVPPEQIRNDQWLGGGKLLVEANSQNVTPVAAVGSIERVVAEMISRRVKVLRHQIDWAFAPASGKSFEKVRYAVACQLRISDDDAEIWVNKMKSLWHMIDRARKEAEVKIRAAAQKEGMRAEATITPAQFFGLNGANGVPQEGLAFLEFMGVFRTNGQQPIYDLFFTCAYSQESDTVKLVGVPDHLQNTELGEMQGREFPADNNYRDIPEPLGRMLRAIRGKADQTAHIEGDGAQEPAEAPAQA